MNEFIREIIYYMKSLIRNMYKVFYIFPIRNNKITCRSFHGRQYSCNPKYFTEFILENHKDKFQIYWIFENPDNMEVPPGVKKLKMHSLNSVYHYVTSGIIIDNNHADVYLPKRCKQIFINTWHGGGAYKRCNNDIKGKWSEVDRKYAKLKGESIDIAISSCRRFSSHISDCMPYFNGTIAEIGMPRNDIFFKSDLEQKKLADKVREFYKIKKKIVLYAPTFRGGYRNPELCKTALDYERVLNALKKKFGDEFVFFMRAHSAYDKSSYESRNAIIASFYPDMQELLCAADVLITDYSSSIWDFGLTSRPCFLFAPDLEEYETTDRGFYTPILEWPGILAKDNDSLIYEIENFDEESYKLKLEKHYKKLKSFESGNACQQLYNIICEYQEKAEVV